jgi:glutaminyl-tRNA synthetase
MSEDRDDPNKGAEPSDFIRTMVVEDLKSGKYGGRVVTRFPPEPNGYLHIGHAKSICLNFGLAEEFGGRCHLRFDDTNPSTEDPEYVEAIQNDIRWLGFTWDELRFASDYFEALYDYAKELIRQGLAYVDSSSEEEIRQQRGTVNEAGTASPFRQRSVDENLDLLRRMRAGEFPDGAHVLRAKIDLSAANMKMRDPLLYRIRHAHHYRRGDAWCIYPMYDYAHCLEDSIEGVTHSLCTLEFENNRDIYDWVLDHLPVPRPRPEQTEFARLKISSTVLSKRKLLALVRGGHVDGWDDPRMPTLAAFRRRGYTPSAIRSFCERVGVAKANSVVDVAQLEHAIRDDLNPQVQRVLCVLRPLKVVITNYPEGQQERLPAPFFPRDVAQEGSRDLLFGREIFIEQEDFQEDPPKGFYRLAPGREVRLRYAYVIRCDEVVRDAAGEIVELRCTYDPATRGGSAPVGRKVKGTLHWVPAAASVPVEVRLYDRLFRVENPDQGDEDFLDQLNPDSLEIVTGARLEPAVADAPAGSRFQFERQGYFYLDPTASTADRPVYNRIVTLKDTWTRLSQQEESASEVPKKAPKKAPKKKAAAGGVPRKARPKAEKKARERSPEQVARARELCREFGLSEGDAEVLAADGAVAAFFAAAARSSGNGELAAKWVINEVLRELKGRALDELPLRPQDLGELVSLVASGRISGRSAKDVFERLLAGEGSAGDIVQREGLVALDRPEDLLPILKKVVAAHGEQLAQYRSGKEALFGFFVGQVMKATRGRAHPQRTQELLRQILDA